MPQIQCRVESIKPLTPVIKQVILAPDTNLEFEAGQYLQVVLAEKDRRPFSIANAPQADGKLELHIGAGDDNPYAQQAIDYLEQNANAATIDVPCGKAQLQLADKPVILLAGGTGFSYTRSLLQQLLKQPLQQEVHLYWGTRTQKDMYAYAELVELAEQHDLFFFHPIIEHPESDWQGKTGWVHEAIMADIADLSPYQVYVAGRFEMAKTVRDDFCAKGLLAENLFGDAYAFI